MMNKFTDFVRQLNGKGAFKIVAGGWGHPPELTVVGGIPTAHNNKRKATILNAPNSIRPLSMPGKITLVSFYICFTDLEC